MRDVVNENDEVIGIASKEEVTAKGLICRVAFIMLVNSAGELLLHQRSANKRSYPLYWSGAAAGHLISGETYEEGASREMMEELSVQAKLKFAGKFFSPEDREMVGVFMGYYNGPIEIEPMEVAQVEYFSPADLAERLPTMQVTSYVERALPLVLPLMGGSN